MKMHCKTAYFGGPGGLFTGNTVIWSGSNLATNDKRKLDMPPRGNFRFVSFRFILPRILYLQPGNQGHHLHRGAVITSRCSFFHGLSVVGLLSSKQAFQQVKWSDYTHFKHRENEEHCNSIGWCVAPMWGSGLWKHRTSSFGAVFSFLPIFNREIKK